MRVSTTYRLTGLHTMVTHVPTPHSIPVTQLSSACPHFAGRKTRLVLCSQDTHSPECEGANMRFLAAGGEQFSGFHCVPVYVCGVCVRACACMHMCCM